MATLTLKSGYNVTLTEDPANGTLTISATDTKYTIDSTLSSTSTNPIQNKVVYNALQGKQDKLTAGTGISISGNTISCTVSALPVVQQTGNSTTSVMSQKAVTDELNKIDSKTANRISSAEANIGKYDITPTTTGYFNISPRPLLQKGSVMYIYIDDNIAEDKRINVEYINAETGVVITNICIFTSNSEKLFKVVVNRDNVSFRLNFVGTLNTVHIRCNISGNVKEYTDVTVPNTEFLLKEDTLFKEIVKNDIRTNIIYNNDISILKGNLGYKIIKNLKSSTRYYFYVGGNKECAELSNLAINLKNSNDTTILNRKVIYYQQNYFLMGNTVFYEFFVDIVEDDDYTLTISKDGNAITLNVIIAENIPLPHYITDKIYSHLQNTTGDYSFGLRWYNASTNGANQLVPSEGRITSYFQDKGTFRIEYDDSNYQLYCRKDSGSSDEVSNGSIITFSAENIVSFSIKNKNTTQRPIIEDVKLIITKINVNKNEVSLQLENGSFDGSGSDRENATRIRSQKIYCDGKSLVIAICPDSMSIQCNLETDNITRRNLGYYINAGVSISYPIGFVRFSFARNDGSILNIDNLTEAERSGIHVYAIEGQTDGKISLAAYNSPDYIKNKADFVCTDANAQYILNACLSCIGSLNIMLYRGSYNLYKLFSDRFGRKCALKTQDALFGVIGKIKLEGESNRVSNIFMTEDCFNLYDSNIKGSLISVPCRNEDGVSTYPLSDTYITIKDIDIKCYDYTKPIVGLDVVFSQETKITDVNYRADGYNSRGGLSAFRTKPHVGCIGIRVGYGSNNGVCNFVKHCRSFYCYKGISCAGEHYVFEDVLTHHCYIGWAFGDYHTTGHFEHPNVMIGCSIEGCYRLMYLTKGGITTEGEFTPNYDGKVNLVYSTLVCIGLSTEEAWELPLDERVEGQPTTRLTLPILEVLKGAYRGRIELDTATSVFENGSGRAFTWRKYSRGQTILGHGNTVDETYG